MLKCYRRIVVGNFESGRLFTCPNIPLHLLLVWEIFGWKVEAFLGCWLGLFQLISFLIGFKFNLSFVKISCIYSENECMERSSCFGKTTSNPHSNHIIKTLWSLIDTQSDRHQYLQMTCFSLAHPCWVRCTNIWAPHLINGSIIVSWQLPITVCQHRCAWYGLALLWSVGLIMVDICCPIELLYMFCVPFCDCTILRLVWMASTMLCRTAFLRRNIIIITTCIMFKLIDWRTIDRSINQSINKSINYSINQSMISWSNNLQSGEWTNQSISQSINR